MSSASGVGIPSFQPPQFSEASGVISRIESQVGRISNLFAQVQQILGEIRSLQGSRPHAADFKGKDGKVDQAAFQKAMQTFQSKLNNLNRRVENTYRKLGQAQAIMRKLQTQDLPSAERRDIERADKAMKQATEAMNQAAQAIKDDQPHAEEVEDSREQLRVEIKVIERNVEIRLENDPSFKEVVQAFSLLAQIVGDPTSAARKANPAIKMPHTPGSGLPPVGTA